MQRIVWAATAAIGAGAAVTAAQSTPTGPAARAALAAGHGEAPASAGARPDDPRGASAPAGGAGLPPIVAFVHDQSSDEILRLRDLNGDGDAHDPGEVTVFYDDSPPAVLGIDNAQGMIALGPWTLLATDNFAPDNIILMTDLNRDGDALDPGEAAVWFSGALPGGFTLTNPADLTARADGSYFLLDNNTLDTANPESLYILEDLNADNDVDDPGEITRFFDLSPAGVSAATTFDAVEDGDGNVYVLDITDPNQIESIDIIDPAGAARTEWLASDVLFSVAGYVLGSSFELEYLPGTNEVLFGALTLGNDQLIVAAEERTGNGVIDHMVELRVLWNEGTHADGFSTGSPRDFFLLPDRTLLWTDGLNDRVMLNRHLDVDANYQDAGETLVFFDAATATANGLPSLSLPLSVTATFAECFADCTFDNTLNIDDVDCFVAAFLAGDLDGADCNADATLNVDDIDCFVAGFLAGCP